MRLAGDGIEWGVTNQGPVDDLLQYYSSYNSIDTSLPWCGYDEVMVSGLLSWDSRAHRLTCMQRA